MKKPVIVWIKSIDKIALGKAVAVLAMSWLALPLLYIMFKKKEVKNETISGGRGEDIHLE